MNNAGLGSLHSQDQQEAATAIQNRLTIDPQSSATWAQLIDFYWLRDSPLQALEAWRQCKQHLHQTRLPYLSLGNVQRDLNDFEAADQAFAKATALAHPSRKNHFGWNHSQILIGLELYEQAYLLAEHRFLLSHYQPWRPAPFWQGFTNFQQPLHNATSQSKPIIVWSEQGFGDTLQYVRWVPLLIQRGYSVQLEVEPPLVPLLRQGLAWLGSRLSVIPKGIGPRPCVAPCHGSLLSLPWLLGGAPLASMLHPDGAGYLHSTGWPKAAPRAGRVPRIGLVWAAGRKSDHPFIRREYERRSLPEPALLCLLEGLEHSGAALVCLQFGSDRQRAAGWGGSFAASLPDGVNLADNACWIGCMDLVITVDTAAAHLVGAMGAPGWVMLPWAADPRWLRNRDDSPWYPSLTLLRQPSPRDWDGLVQLVLARFHQWRMDWFDH